MLRRRGAVVIFVLCLVFAGNTFATPFLKMGDVKGESTGDGHKDWIVILAWKTTAENTGVGRGRGAVGPGEVVFTKYIDSTSPEIYRLFANCGSLSEVVLEVPIIPESGTSGPGERVLRARFGPGVRVTRVVAGALGDDGLPTEQVTLSYDEVVFEIVDPVRGR